MRRVHRTALHRGSNHARVDAYTTELQAIFSDWLDGTGLSVSTLIDRLDTAAHQNFAQAFAQGRHQAYPKRRPSAAGEALVGTKLTANRHYLQNSLQPDLERRIVQWKLQQETAPLADALRQSFASRINQYGGAIWNVQEAGFVAGQRQARADLAARLRGPLLADDSEEEAQPNDYALAFALGLTVAGLLLLLRSGRDRSGVTSDRGTPPTGLGPQDAQAQQVVDMPGALQEAGIQVGTAYNAEDGACDPCDANAHGGENGDGIYWDEEPPLPGDDCEGANNCRCSLETAVDDSLAA